MPTPSDGEFSTSFFFYLRFSYLNLCSTMTCNFYVITVELAIRAAEWAKQRLAMEGQAHQPTVPGVHPQPPFGIGGVPSQVHQPGLRPNHPSQLPGTSEGLPPPLMGQPQNAPLTHQHPPRPPFSYTDSEMQEDVMELDEDVGPSLVPPPLMGQQPPPGMQRTVQPEAPHYQQPMPGVNPPIDNQFAEPQPFHDPHREGYPPYGGATEGSYQPIPQQEGPYGHEAPHVETKQPLLATPPNLGYNPPMQQPYPPEYPPESQYMHQGGQPFNQEQVYSGAGFIPDSILHPASDLKKKALPAWVKEGLQKMYKEKQKEEEAKLKEAEMTKKQGDGPRWSVDDDDDDDVNRAVDGDSPKGLSSEETSGMQPRGILKKSVVASEVATPDSQQPADEQSNDDSDISNEGQNELSEEELVSDFYMSLYTNFNLHMCVFSLYVHDMHVHIRMQFLLLA